MKNVQVDLKTFCEPEPDTVYAINDPWVIAGWRYATDGMVIVRVSAPGEADSPPRHEDGRRRRMDIGSFFDDHKNAGVDDWEPWPTVEPCGICLGSGRRQCDQCDGSGECDECLCGAPHACGKCRGEGERYCGDCLKPGSFGHRFGEAELSLFYAFLISQLPSVQYAPSADEKTPVRFRFTGGEGLVAPVVSQSVLHSVRL